MLSDSDDLGRGNKSTGLYPKSSAFRENDLFNFSEFYRFEFQSIPPTHKEKMRMLCVTSWPHSTISTMLFASCFLIDEMSDA